MHIRVIARGDIADDGRELAPMSAMTAHWPTLTHAVDAARGREAIEKALALLGRKNRILLVTPTFNEHSDPYPGRSAEYPPGVRENAPGQMYGAYLRDPDGNKICAFAPNENAA